jgi:lipopolysaccharide transport system ATP-binding protein
MSTVISVENISKLYRLGEIGTGSLAHDVNRWWHRVRGKEDPYLKIGESNDRTSSGSSDYVWSLRDVSFKVEQGEVLGIIGRNGAGKSTLLKILSRVTKQTNGRIRVKGRIASLLEVGTGFHPELTGRENIFLNGAILGMRKHEIQRKFDEIVDFSGCERYIDTPVKRYSSGMYVRLAFAVAAHLESEILILDEVLAVGDAEFQKKCLGKMKDVSRGGRTVLFVSHNMHAIQNLCTKAIGLKNGSIYSRGETGEVIKDYLKTSEIAFEKLYKPKTSNPSITLISIDPVELEKENLVVTVGFDSPFELNPPVAGIVIYSAMGTPVFGTNPRFHTVEGDLGKRKSGNLKMVVNNLPIHGGTYSLSVWLGDWETDYDKKEEAISFEFKSGSTNSKTPNPENIGFIDIEGKWSYSQHNE